MSKIKRKLLTVVMDGVGERQSNFGNAVKIAYTPNLSWLKKNSLFTTLKAHGTYVGLPADSDIGNSEVGHNALGAGRVFDQGAKLVQASIDTGAVFSGHAWKELVAPLKGQSNRALHFIGLLSDGNVHSNQAHLHKLIAQAKKEGVAKVRLHLLIDGRDVGEKSAETYIGLLSSFLAQIVDETFDVKVASGGGRMTTTMDRYEADWKMVERGWNAHVHGIAELKFKSLPEALAFFREDPKLIDQYFPPFVIDEGNGAVGKIKDNDSVVLFNFRGDRAIQISRAFYEDTFTTFDRGNRPKVVFAGMMEYDGDLHIPPRYLVAPPQISKTLGEFFAQKGLRQFACSETQKFGHVTYFWNGNRSGKFDEKLEEYLEIPSDNIQFDLRPWMKAQEITDVVIQKMRASSFDFARINYPNGDMVGHTGNFDASVLAVATVDLSIGRLIQAARETGTMLLITADHGNCDEMFDTNKEGPADWLELPREKWPKPKTAHTLSEVPLYFYDPLGMSNYRWRELETKSIANVARTTVELLNVQGGFDFLPGLIEVL